MAETFAFEDEDGSSLGEVARLDTMVTVVDEFQFFGDFAESAFLRDRNLAAGEGDDRTVVDLLIDQVEFAGVIVVNKCDATDAATLGRLEGVLRKLNPRAKIVRAIQGRVPLEEVLATGRFAFNKG